MSEENPQTPPAETPAAQPQATELQPQANAPAPDGVAEQPGAPAQPPEQPEARLDAPPREEGRANKRFSDLSRERNQAREEAAYWKGVAEAARAGQPQPAAQPQAVQPSGPPDPESFPQGRYDPDYAIAMAEYRFEQKLKTEKEAAATAEREAAEARTVQEGRARWEGVCEQAERAGQGFENALSVLESRDVRRPTMDLITTAEHPLHVAEYFGRKPDQLRALLDLPIVEQARHIARLDVRISDNIRASQARQVETPAPVTAPTPSPAAMPTAPAGGSAAPFDPNKGSMEDFVRWRTGA